MGMSILHHVQSGNGNIHCLLYKSIDDGGVHLEECCYLLSRIDECGVKVFITISVFGLIVCVI